MSVSLEKDCQENEIYCQTKSKSVRDGFCRFYETKIKRAIKQMWSVNFCNARISYVKNANTSIICKF